MPRGHRRALIAAFGWLALAAAPLPNRGTHNETAKATQHIQDSLNAIARAETKQAEPGEYQAPCEAGKQNNKSDLCAQWYAALAARDAADWSYWTLVLGVGSLTLSGVGLIALYVTIRLGREANAISRDSAMRELRAYLMADYGGHYGIMSGRKVSVAFGIMNVGQTPANCFLGHIHAEIRDINDPPEQHPAPEIGTEVGELLGPQKRNQFRSIACEKLSKADYLAIKAREKAVFVVGRFRYRDVFGRWYIFEINHCSDQDLTIRGMHVCGKGAHEYEVKQEPPNHGFFSSIWSKIRLREAAPAALL